MFWYIVAWAVFAVVLLFVANKIDEHQDWSWKDLKDPWDVP